MSSVDLPSRDSPAPTRSAYQQVIRVLVGPDEEVFSIHKHKLLTTSDFFRKALNGPWVEARKDEVKLPEVTPDVFAMYSLWVYEKSVKRPEEDVHGKPCWADRISGTPLGQKDIATTYDAPPCQHHALWTLISAYALGDILACPDFKNDIVDEIISRLGDHHLVFAVGGVSQVYNVTNGRSPLRRLAVDRAIYESSVQYFKEDLADWDVDFVRELAAQLLTKRDKRIAAENAPYKHSICRTYHEHKEGALDCLGKVVEKKKGETGSS